MDNAQRLSRMRSGGTQTVAGPAGLVQLTVEDSAIVAMNVNAYRVGPEDGPELAEDALAALRTVQAPAISQIGVK